MVDKITDSKPSPEPKAEPMILTAEELVANLAFGGPGTRIKVRARFLPKDTVKEGVATDYSEYAKGPAVVYKENPDRPDYVTGILPLGGQTVYIAPPRIRGYPGDRRIIPAFQSGHSGPLHLNIPVDPITQEKYQFEVINPPLDESAGQQVLSNIVDAPVDVV